MHNTYLGNLGVGAGRTAAVGGLARGGGGGLLERVDTGGEVVGPVDGRALEERRRRVLEREGKGRAK